MKLSLWSLYGQRPFLLDNIILLQPLRHSDPSRFPFLIQNWRWLSIELVLYILIQRSLWSLDINMLPRRRKCIWLQFIRYVYVSCGFWSVLSRWRWTSNWLQLRSNSVDFDILNLLVLQFVSHLRAPIFTTTNLINHVFPTFLYYIVLSRLGIEFFINLVIY